MSEPPSDLLRLLGRREPLVQRIADGPVRKRDLVGSLDVSRSTVDRSIRDLVAAAVVDRGPDGFELTLAGRLLFEEYRRFRDRATGIQRTSDVLAVLPSDAEVHPSLLVGATVTEATRTAPYRPMETHLEIVRRASSMTILSTAVSSQYLDVARECILEGELRVTVVCAPQVVEYLVSEEASTLERAFATGRVELCELPDSPPFSLAVIEATDGTYASLLAYDDDGIRGHVHNDDPDAVAWAEEYIRRHRDRAESVAPPPRSSD